MDMMSISDAVHIMPPADITVARFRLMVASKATRSGLSGAGNVAASRLYTS